MSIFYSHMVRGLSSPNSLRQTRTGVCALEHTRTFSQFRHEAVLVPFESKKRGNRYFPPARRSSSTQFGM